MSQEISSTASINTLFNPETSINSGQMFLWEKLDDAWYGIYGNHVLKFSRLKKSNGGANNSKERISIKNDEFEFFSVPEIKGWQRILFRLDDDIEKILSGFSKDAFISKVRRSYPGLRLMRQEPQQCMLSFVCASNTNILVIRTMLKNLSKKFGSKLRVDGKEFFSFPDAHRINKASVDELRSCLLGYRTKAIKAVAQRLVSGDLDIKYISNASYEDARKELMKVYGIGNKIADCIMLFSLEKLEAFPIDVWITRALTWHYSWLLTRIEEENKKITPKISSKQYEMLSDVVRNYFGKNSGYAQQYLFYHMRQEAAKKW